MRWNARTYPSVNQVRYSYPSPDSPSSRAFSHRETGWAQGEIIKLVVSWGRNLMMSVESPKRPMGHMLENILK